MKITLTSVMVDDQEKALRFYTEVLGFVKKTDLPAGEFRWITVVSPEGPEGVELLLEPNSHPAAKAFQGAMLRDGIPLASFQSSDLYGECERLRRNGVVFRAEPANMGPVHVALIEDTVGNLIQLHQPV